MIFVYKVHQRPRGGERLAGQYNAVERFLRLLRLSRFVVRVRFVGTSREGWRSARRRAAGSGREALTFLQMSGRRLQG